MLGELFLPVSLFRRDIVVCRRAEKDRSWKGWDEGTGF